MGTDPEPRRRKLRSHRSTNSVAPRVGGAGTGHAGHAGAVGAVIVLAVTLFAHLPGLDGDLLGWDDRRALLDFTQWRGLGWSNIRWAFTTTAMAIYRPLTWLSYGLDHTLTGLAPYGFHRTNLAIHMALAGCLYALVVRWLRVVAPTRPPTWAAALSTLAWSVHPLRVQAVAWVSARADLLAGFFLVLATMAWLDWTIERRRASRIAWLILYASSLLSKPVALGAPIAWWLAERWLEQRRHSRRRAPATSKLDRILSFSIAAGGAVAILIAKGAWTPSSGGLPSLPPSAAFVALHNAVFPIYKTFWPTRLGYYEPRYPFDPFTAPYVIGGVTAVVLGIIVWRLRRTHAGLLVASVAYLSLLAPMLGVVPFGYELVADRFSFVPLLVWSIAVAGPVADRLATLTASRDKIVRVAAVAVVLLLATMTREQTKHWETSRAFWKHNYEIDPRSGMANSGMGDAMLKENRVSEAAEYYRRARELQPTYEPTLLGLAFVDLVQGRPNDAIPKLERYLGSHPENRSAKRYLAQAYEGAGRSDEAAAVREMIDDEERERPSRR